MPNVPQLVQLAISTVVRTSAVQNMGVDFSAGAVISDNFTAQMTDAIRVSTQSLVDRKLILFGSVTVDRLASSNVLIRFKWTDLTTNLEQTTTVS